MFFGATSFGEVAFAELRIVAVTPTPTPPRHVGHVGLKPKRWWELLEAEHLARLRAQRLEDYEQHEVAEEALEKVQEATDAIAQLEENVPDEQIKRLIDALDNWRRARKSNSIISRAIHLSKIAEAAASYARRQYELQQDDEDAVALLIS